MRPGGQEAKKALSWVMNLLKKASQTPGILFPLIILLEAEVK